MKRKVIFGFLAIALTELIIFTCTRSQQNHYEEGNIIANLVNKIFFGNRLNSEELSNLTFSVGAKLLGHFGLFLLDGLFVYLFFNELSLKERTKILCVVCYGLCLATLGEVIELFASERVSSFRDVIINFSGYILPILLIKMTKE